ncbi:hypothetical protein N8T08_003072 [Aspergillus melleus]|uniref:Uncharacterized protein n=1 Tax=Aspergillus melleus TaxID=138277 RepID=A0ACC3B7M2_9EURO|nr:hypothetical protein N8T08_003072 [Aspergillus melleus]
MPKKPKRVPSAPSEWKRRVRVKKIKNANIHKVKLKSASVIGEGQFLALRALWKIHDHLNPDLKRFDLEPWVSQAQEMLDRYESWQIYTENGAVEAKEMAESTFVMAKYWQAMADEISSNKSSPSELLGQLCTRTKDEEIVTSALFSLLCGLIVHTGIPNRWTVHRKPFKAQFNYASFEARVDGYLEDKSLAQKVRALVEVQPVLRQKQILKIGMQEAAQMVAWILSELELDKDGCLNLPGRHLHVSQDRSEIYITFAEYDDEYINYLRDDSNPDSNLHFLTMHQYGPWGTSNLEDMRDLGKFLLAICLRAQFDKQNEGVEVQESKSEKSETDEEDDNMSVDSNQSADVDMDENADEGDHENEDDDEEDDDDDEEYVDDEDPQCRTRIGRNLR